MFLSVPGIEKEEGQNNVTMSFFLSPWKVYIRSGNKGEFVNVASHLLGGEFLMNSKVNVTLSPGSSSYKENLLFWPTDMKEMASPKVEQEKFRATDETLS